ncbi:hypothetical protein POSPLADRAFT_1141658 [Postia placenta MAD-698-R-SB12]|uniref:Uncharacterized protein n=1 Tax=Postia placenta MAD-698-R-SB12 TaxID=670580 RepID=A0A1X6N3N7_9APHY|nr:hypothetical protein POSPLADRAFT_1141658 [Postia placenta MAD-698-R-SB12]OSX63086.1 hypothetical protein POSPLADRAFT_1141658 [Postia placenta MAD-698-R-SB12]
MATSQLSDGVYLRSTINATPAADPQVLSAFSSDIIPLGHTQPDIATLVAAYSNFIAHEIDPSESKTRIYLRGKAVINGAAKKVETQVSLKTIPNELILWPQAWENAAQIGQATLSASKDGEVVVTNTPIVYNPTQGLGRHDTLIAEATTGAASASTTTLVQQVHNWRNLVKLVGEDATLATYNVVFADPCSTNVSLTTRLRVFENQASSVNMAFGIEAVGTPASDIDVSLVGFGTTTGSKPITFGQSRTNILPSKLLTTPAILPKDFDGTVTLNVFNDKKQTFGDYSSISVIAYAVTAVGGKETYTTLGAEHIVFHSDTRVKKVLNKFARLREAAVIQDVTNAATSIGPSFYFRMTVNDTDQFPRPESDTPEHSCDIQPWGTLPDANVQSDLGPANYRVDVSDKRNVYSTQGCIIYDHTSGGDPKIAIRKYNTTAAEAPVLFSEPFNFSDPPPPPGQDHYCLIAECKPDGLDADGNSYEWPHQETGDFATGPEFITWLRSNPCQPERTIPGLLYELHHSRITGDELFRRRNTGKPSVPAVRTVTHDYPNVKIPAEDNTGDKQPPKIGGAHPCRVLGEKYRLNAAIYIDYIVGTDGMGYNIGLVARTLVVALASSDVHNRALRPKPAKPCLAEAHIAQHKSSKDLQEAMEPSVQAWIHYEARPVRICRRAIFLASNLRFIRPHVLTFMSCAVVVNTLFLTYKAVDADDTVGQNYQEPGGAAVPFSQWKRLYEVASEDKRGF